jgi:hypothetical protein
MTTALIGHTGFVGSTLVQQKSFDAFYNSKNIPEIAGGSFDAVVCAAAPAAKWLANTNPAQDAETVGRLMSYLKQISASWFTLISTVDVFAVPVGQTEETPPTREGLGPYGEHRLRLEEFVQERFERHCVIRLPALFGDGLKKNALYDLIHGNRIDFIHPEAAFQWYPMERLGADMDRILESEIPLVHFATEPVKTSEIVAEFFPSTVLREHGGPAPRYDFHTVHGSVFGRDDGYILGREQVMDRLQAYVGRAVACAEETEQ